MLEQNGAANQQAAETSSADLLNGGAIHRGQLGCTAADFGDGGGLACPIPMAIKAGDSGDTWPHVLQQSLDGVRPLWNRVIFQAHHVFGASRRSHVIPDRCDSTFHLLLDVLASTSIDFGESGEADVKPVQLGALTPQITEPQFTECHVLMAGVDDQQS